MEAHVDVTCPVCGRVRPVRLVRARTATFTGRCPECYDAQRKQSRYFTGRKYASWRTNARNHGREWSLDPDYLDSLWERQGGRCALTGRPMVVGAGDRLVSASLDRIDNTRGYVRGNVQFVLSAINTAKQNLPQDEFLFLCRDVVLRGGK